MLERFRPYIAMFTRDLLLRREGMLFMAKRLMRNRRSRHGQVVTFPKLGDKR